MKKQQGFTLIELLVVIAIIGLLSTLAVLSFGGVREKARDSQRLSDVKQMSTILEIEESNNAGTTISCTTATDCDAGSRTTDVGAAAGLAPAELSQFAKFIDPTAGGTGTACHALAVTADGVCDYSIANGAGSANGATDDYAICFYMEAPSNLGAAGMYKIEEGGAIVADAAPCGV